MSFVVQVKDLQFWKQLKEQYEPENLASSRDTAEQELNDMIENAKSETKNGPTVNDTTIDDKCKSDDGISFLNSDPMEPASKRDMVSTPLKKCFRFTYWKVFKILVMGFQNQL